MSRSKSYETGFMNVTMILVVLQWSSSQSPHLNPIENFGIKREINSVNVQLTCLQNQMEKWSRISKGCPQNVVEFVPWRIEGKNYPILGWCQMLLNGDQPDMNPRYFRVYPFKIESHWISVQQNFPTLSPKKGSYIDETCKNNNFSVPKYSAWVSTRS